MSRIVSQTFPRPPRFSILVGGDLREKDYFLVNHRGSECRHKVVKVTSDGRHGKVFTGDREDRCRSTMVTGKLMT